jgi:hypothetical protein
MLVCMFMFMFMFIFMFMFMCGLITCVLFMRLCAGGRQITMRAEESMHGFWSVLEWGANTILFVW